MSPKNIYKVTPVVIPESLASEIEKWGAQTTNEKIIEDLKAKVAPLKNRNLPSAASKLKDETRALNPRTGDDATTYHRDGGPKIPIQAEIGAQ